jgi:hypothetical protein
LSIPLLYLRLHYVILAEEQRAVSSEQRVASSEAELILPPSDFHGWIVRSDTGFNVVTPAIPRYLPKVSLPHLAVQLHSVVVWLDVKRANGAGVGRAFLIEAGSSTVFGSYKQHSQLLHFNVEWYLPLPYLGTYLT